MTTLALDSLATIPPDIESHKLREPRGAKTLLAVLAHPDDESFGPGGTLARYAAQGVDVHLACATRGESGTVEPKHLVGYADIASLRIAELNCAVRVLGLTGLHYLGFRDSGM